MQQRRRPTPFDLIFEAVSHTTFPAIRSALAVAGDDPRDRDAFLMVPEVVTLLRDLRPDGGLGEGIGQLAALVHHGYLFWDAGSVTMDVSLERLAELLGSTPGGENGPDQPPFYTQLPAHRIWAQVIPGNAHEPLDGYFQYTAGHPGVLQVLGVFGIHPDRPGFSVVEVSGPRPIALLRADGSALFAPILSGGDAAGLFSIAGEEELLDLGWRSREMAVAAEASRWRA